MTEDLRERFGYENVFIDIDSIEIGADFADVIADWVARADAFLAVIGRNWIDSKHADGQRRINDPDDYVRIEIEAALRQNQRVVPVLIHGATPPDPEQLPATVAPLMRRNAVELTRRYWEDDVRRLIAALEKISGGGHVDVPDIRVAGEPDRGRDPVIGSPEPPRPSAIPVLGRDYEQPRETAPTATATTRETTRDDDIKITVDPVVPVRPPSASDRPVAPVPPTAAEPTRQTPRRNWVKLGALAAGLAAVVAVVLVATSGGGGSSSGNGGGTTTATSTGTGHGSATPSAKSVVDEFFNAYNRGDNGTAAQLWAPAVNKVAVYRPGYPLHAPLQHLATIAAVQGSVLSHGCQRSSYTANVSNNVVTATYWSFGQRPGQVKCTAGNQHWQDVFTIENGHIVRDISTRLG